MAKKLKKWNGRAASHKYRNGQFYIAAYSQKQAAELLSIVAYGEPEGNRMLNEIKNYYSTCWGNPMDGIEPTEPCVYATESHRLFDKPKLIYPIKNNN